MQSCWYEEEEVWKTSWHLMMNMLYGQFLHPVPRPLSQSDTNETYAWRSLQLTFAHLPRAMQRNFSCVLGKKLQWIYRGCNLRFPGRSPIILQLCNRVSSV